MKKTRLTVCLTILLILSLLASCGSADAGTAAEPAAAANPVVELEMTKDYDSADPFVNEKLFCVTGPVSELEFAVSFEMRGEGAVLEIADNETGEILWSEAWTGTVERTESAVTLADLDPDREYVVRLTGMKIEYARAAVSADNLLVEERARPRRQED